MAFSKAPFKRFNEKTGCAPPVGSYDPKQKDKAVSMQFDKGGDRFKTPKDILLGPGSFDIDTPVKKCPLNQSTCSNGGDKKKNHKTSENSLEMAKIKDLEREIKRLVQERNNLDKQLTHREDDIVKLEGRLQTAHTDKISLQAKIASLEKELKELKKSNEVLRNKMTNADTACKKQESLQHELSSLKHQMECKNKEISRVKHELDITQNHQNNELHILENVVMVIEERIHHLDIDADHNGTPRNNSEISSSKRKGSEDLAVNMKTENPKKIVEKLQKRFNETIQEFDKKIQLFKTRYERIMADKVDLEQSLEKKEMALKDYREKSDTLEKNRSMLSTKYSTLKKMIKDLKSETWIQEDDIRYLKGEVFSKQDNLKEEGQILFEVRAEKASLLEKLEILEEENGTLNENIKTLTEKYHVIEGQFAEEQNQNNVKSDQVQSQLDVTKCHLMEVQDQYQFLQSKNKELVHSINKEKENVEKFIYELDEQKQLTSDLQMLVVDKEEKITDLEISLEATKVELQNLMDSIEDKEADITNLQHRIHSLEEVERSLQSQIQQENKVNQETTRQHADRILHLEHREISVTEENIKLCRELEEMNHLKSAVEEKMEDGHKELTNQLQLVLKEKERIQTELEITQKKQASLKEEVSNLEGKLTTVEDTLEIEKQTRLDIAEQMTGNIQTVIQEKQDLINNLQSLTSQIEQVKSDNVQLIEQIQELEKVKVQQQQEILHQKEELGKVKVDKENTDDKLKKLDAKFHSLNKENTQLMNEIDFLQEKKLRDENEIKDQIETLKSDLLNLKEKDENQTEAISQHVECLEDAHSEIEKLRNDTMNLKEKETVQTETISQHLKSLEDAYTREKELDKEKVELTSKLDQVTTQKEAISKQFSELVSSLEEVSNKSTEKETNWRSEQERLTTELQTVTNQKEILQQRIASLEEEKGALGELVKHLETKLEDVERESRTEIDSIKTLLENTEHQTETLQSVNLTLQETLEDQGVRSHSLENDVEKLTQEIHVFKDFKGKYEDKVKEISYMEQEMMSQIDSLKVKIQDTEAGKDMLNQQIIDINNVVQTLNTENARLEKEIDTKEEVIERLTLQYESEIKTLKTEVKGQQSCNNDLTENIQLLEHRLKELESETVKYRTQTEAIQNEVKHKESESINRIEDLSQLLHSVKEDRNQLTQEVQSLQSQINTIEEEKEEMAKHYEDELMDLRDQAKAMDKDNNWKKMYEDLMTKVEPFMAQIDAYEMEKMALLGRSQFAQAEMDKLSQAYAKLLGHQNQKQKIHHIVKIKEENNSLKKETTSLREQVNKLKRTNQKLEEKTLTLEGRKRFDPSKAFQSKENTVPPSSPLKDGNRK
ncbi:CD168 [Mytilus edulis]|uniref:HMMR n=1 Tax=Mytilus edulis TaxID=6550 RepID=A0A8S3VSL6_MYTED|nr:CD168 [Mytilus edulis]